MARYWPPRTPDVPAVWEAFCVEWLRISRPQMQRWWWAVCRSSWARPVTLRGTIRAHEIIDTQADQVTHLYRDLLEPRLLLTVLDDLVRQRLLTYRETSPIAEAVLTKVDHQGGWRGLASTGPAPLVDLNAAIHAVLDRV